MNRRELRENVFKLLFQVDFYTPEEMQKQKELYFLRQLEIDEEDIYKIRDRFDNIVPKIQEIDENIEQAAEGWKPSRMGKTDLTLIRLAVYEMKYDESVPVGVAINEAVEISKKFGGDDSPSFINGILAKLV